MRQVVHLVLTLVRTNKISTLRDVYYMDCRVFEDQSKSDRAIELVARCLNVPRYGTLNPNPQPSTLNPKTARPKPYPLATSDRPIELVARFLNVPRHGTLNPDS